MRRFVFRENVLLLKGFFQGIQGNYFPVKQEGLATGPQDANPFTEIVFTPQTSQFPRVYKGLYPECHDISMVRTSIPF